MFVKFELRAVEDVRTWIGSTEGVFYAPKLEIGALNLLQ